jgi:Ca2+-binding RTX toxin-like protein
MPWIGISASALRRTATLSTVWLLAMGLHAGPANAGVPVQFDVSAVLNADVIINIDPAGPSGFDASQDSIDGSNFAFATQSATAQEGCSGDPDGLRDDASFTENVFHPAVQLSYRDTDNGNNARLSPGPDSYSIDVPDGQYSAVHVFVTSTDGSSSMDVRLTYATGTTSTASFVVPDWFDDPGSGYALADGRDRMDLLFACEDADTAAIFGFPFQADASRTLLSIEITRTDDDGSRLAFFGATGVTEPMAAPGATCGGAPATIVGTDGDDTLTGTSGADIVAGLGGRDSISGLGGSDVLCGGEGNDVVLGGGGKDRALGDAGKDRLNGGGGGDRLKGGPGPGKDSCVGGGGRDRASGCERRKGIP